MFFNYFFSKFVVNDIIFLGMIFFTGLVILRILVFLSWFFQRGSAEMAKLSPYECGFQPFDITAQPFNISYYLVGLAFVLFDVELIFILPIVKIINMSGVYGLFEVLCCVAFCLILFFSLGWECQMGAFDFSESLKYINVTTNNKNSKKGFINFFVRIYLLVICFAADMPPDEKKKPTPSEDSRDEVDNDGGPSPSPSPIGEDDTPPNNNVGSLKSDKKKLFNFKGLKIEQLFEKIEAEAEANRKAENDPEINKKKIEEIKSIGKTTDYVDKILGKESLSKDYEIQPGVFFNFRKIGVEWHQKQVAMMKERKAQGKPFTMGLWYYDVDRPRDIIQLDDFGGYISEKIGCEIWRLYTDAARKYYGWVNWEEVEEIDYDYFSSLIKSFLEAEINQEIGLTKNGRLAFGEDRNEFFFYKIRIFIYGMLPVLDIRLLVLRYLLFSSSVGGILVWQLLVVGGEFKLNQFLNSLPHVITGNLRWGFENLYWNNGYQFLFLLFVLIPLVFIFLYIFLVLVFGFGRIRLDSYYYRVIRRQRKEYDKEFMLGTFAYEQGLRLKKMISAEAKAQYPDLRNSTYKLDKFLLENHEVIHSGLNSIRKGIRPVYFPRFMVVALFFFCISFGLITLGAWQHSMYIFRNGIYVLVAAYMLISFGFFVNCYFRFRTNDDYIWGLWKYCLWIILFVIGFLVPWLISIQLSLDSMYFFFISPDIINDVGALREGRLGFINPGIRQIDPRESVKLRPRIFTKDQIVFTAEWNESDTNLVKGLPRRYRILLPDYLRKRYSNLEELEHSKTIVNRYGQVPLAEDEYSRIERRQIRYWWDVPDHLSEANKWRYITRSPHYEEVELKTGIQREGVPSVFDGFGRPFIKRKPLEADLLNPKYFHKKWFEISSTRF